MGPLMQACKCRAEVNDRPCGKCVNGRVPTAAGWELLELVEFGKANDHKKWEASRPKVQGVPK